MSEISRARYIESGGFLLGGVEAILPTHRATDSAGLLLGGPEESAVTRASQENAAGVVLGGKSTITRTLGESSGNYMASWTTKQALHVESEIASGGQATDYLDLAAGDHDQANVSISIVGAGARDTRVDLQVLASTDDGDTYDTVPTSERTFNVRTTAIVYTFAVTVPNVAIRIINRGPEAVTYKSWCALRKFVPA